MRACPTPAVHAHARVRVVEIGVARAVDSAVLPPAGYAAPRAANSAPPRPRSEAQARADAHEYEDGDANDADASAHEAACSTVASRCPPSH